jgi:hypothetical protein
LARISARAIFQSLSYFSRASFSCVSDSAAAVFDCRYCQIEVAINPASPITKLERKL